MEKVNGKVMAVFGTRPEAIKLAPVIGELRSRGIPVTVVITAQHRQMIDQSLAVFNIKPDIDLDIMKPGQTLSDIVIRSTAGIGPVLESVNPDIVLVQGDTTSAAAMALAAANHRIKVGHVEAGLRTHDKDNPFPEEINRQIIGRIADLHFAPTAWARDNLLREGVPEHTVFVTGNTVVDAINKMRPDEAEPDDKTLLNLDFAGHKVVLVTTHRRENFGQPLRDICAAIKRLAEENPDAQFILPVHPNPNVKPVVESALAGVPGIALVSPLSYTDLLWLLSRCHFALTDSGGIQEEAPSFKKPVLVMRQVTERPEGIEAGVAKLVGTNPAAIVVAATELLTDPQAYKAMVSVENPYGDGLAASRIADILAGTPKTK